MTSVRKPEWERLAKLKCQPKLEQKPELLCMPKLKQELSLEWQPILEGQRLILRPLLPEDYSALFQAASDPLIWEQHPDSQRYTRERFDLYFEAGLKSKGALAIIERDSGLMIGSSRYRVTSDATIESVEIGYTFLARRYWGGDFNRELKGLMLNYAFQRVENVLFVVGEKNLRSRRAMEKIGGRLVSVPPHAKDELEKIFITGDLSGKVVFLIRREEYLRNPLLLASTKFDRTGEHLLVRK